MIDALEGANHSLRELLYHCCEVERVRGKKEKPTQKQPALQAPPAQRPARWCGAVRLAGLEQGVWRVLRGLRAAPRAPRAAPAHPAPGTAFRRGRRAHAWRAPECRAPQTALLPGRPRAARGSGFVYAPVPGLQPRPPEWQEPGGSSPVRLQRSSARRAVAPALGIPAAAPAAVAARSTVWDARGRALRFVAYS